MNDPRLSDRAVSRKKVMQVMDRKTAGAAGALLGLGMVHRLRHPPMSLRGRTALVTGGSRGLGLALAQALVAEGARVAICGRDRAALERAARRLGCPTAPVLAVQCDVTDPAQVERMIDIVRRRFGPVDILINNAGAMLVAPEAALTLRDYHTLMDTNFWGVVHTVRAVLPEMRARRTGRIVNVGSIGGKIAVPHLIPYSASKFATVGLSQGLQAELARDGVRVTLVSPGLMRTGSPPNASFKGKHRAEYAWFSIADSLPLLTVPADRAARRILDACRRGDPEVAFPLYSRAAAVLQATAPSLTGGVLSLMNRLLPRHMGPPNRSVSGWESRSAASPSWLTALGDQASRRYNQMGGSDMATTSQSRGKNVGTTERMLSAAAGAAAMVYGIRSGRLRAVMLPLGGALMGRALTGRCPVNRALGRNTARTEEQESPVASVERGEGIRVERSVVVNRPRHELYRFWRDFRNLPSFMEHLESVTVLDEQHSRWVAKAPAGRRVEWNAEIHNEIDNELIAWRSLPGSDVNHAGSVHFRGVADRPGTEVRVVLRYEPPAGRVGATIAKLFGEEPSQQIEDDLRRFKAVTEAGEIPSTAGQPAGPA